MFKTYIEEECIFLGGMHIEKTPEGDLVPPSPNFGHFIFEYLNRFAIFDLHGLTHKLPVVIYENLPERWIGFLELLGISRDRLIRIPEIETPAFRKVWVSSAPIIVAWMANSAFGAKACIGCGSACCRP